MPGQRSTKDENGDKSRHDVVVRQAVITARGRLRRRRAAQVLAATFFLPIVGAAAWVALVRFTLLDLPRWPVLLFLIAWFLGFAFWVLRQRITTAQSAHYLDSALALDERMTTLIELQGRARLGGPSASAHGFIEPLAEDTALIIIRRIDFLPHPFRCNLKVWQSLAGSAALLALVAALMAPTYLDAVRNERSVVRAALDTQARKLAALRAEIVNRPDLPDSLKQSLAAELQALESRLTSQHADRAEALAIIASAEEKVRSILPGVASADFGPIAQASQAIQKSAESNIKWGGVDTGDVNDLTSAAEALRAIKTSANLFTPVEARAVAGDLERAAAIAALRDPELAQSLLEAAGALRKKDPAKAASALDVAIQKFTQAEQQKLAAETLEGALAKLEESRDSIAKAGTSTNKRGQVGFRRGVRPQASPETGSVQASSGAGAEADGGASQTLDQNGLRIGQNQPAFGLPGGAGTGGQSSQSGGAGSRQDGQQSGSQGAGKAGSGGGAGTGSQSGNMGRITGPINGSGGSSNSEGGAQGNGISGPSGQTGQDGQQSNSSVERIYVPGKNGTSAPAGSAGQAAPEKASSGVSGRVGEGASEDPRPSSPGMGTLNTINTPYKEVLGAYTQQATQALDRAYVPSDAKEYVRDYFSNLGK